jgi:selenocysteine-specific elongation factor
MYVVGTAGHVDHGKSSLVKALTGIDPDRLPEEKARGMTIDLGFAWLRLPGGRQISLVDVPGHERFIRNMLAGVGCIDAAILVVAANDGVMPQTREHLAILDLLQVRSGVAAITKTDLVDADLLEMAIQETRDVLAGTTLVDAPLVPLSVVTGEGLSQFVTTLDRVLAESPARPDLGRPRLWIDRVFTVAGFGTVVTGTLIDGILQAGQEIEVLPAGRRSRIRALETHKSSIDVAQPGTRVAVNLARLAVEDLKRGDLLSTPGHFNPTKRLDARLRCLSNVPGGLKDGTVGRLFVGSADVEAKVRLLNAEVLAPGEAGLAQLSLAEPTVVVRGDRFVLRHSAVNVTVGGGVVIDPHPLHHTRYRPPVISALEIMERGAPREIVRQVLGDKWPIETPRLPEWTGLTPAELDQAVSGLVSTGEAMLFGVEARGSLPSPGVYLVSRSGWQRLLNEMARLVGDYHRRYPLRRAMPKEDLRSRLEMKAELFPFVVSQAAKEAVMVEEGAAVRLSDHRVQLTPEQEDNVRRLLRAHQKMPHTPPTVSAAAREYGVDGELLQVLVEQGDLVKVGDEEIFLRPVYDEMVARIVQRIEREGSITLAQAREVFPDTTRRYLMALLEHLDELKITRRVGDGRVLR